MSRNEQVLQFWDRRAELGPLAGTRDIIAKQLEMQAISSFVRDGMRVLDYGCGNGLTAIEIARKFDVSVLGVDFSAEMVRAAAELAANESLRGKVQFEQRDVRDKNDQVSDFDLVYTERMIINLPDWPAQAEAIAFLTTLVRDGGIFAMCENSQDSVEALNQLRRELDLSPIVPPWHNRYLRNAEIDSLKIPGVVLEEVRDYSSTYYFLSRIVNAALAKAEGHEPSYDHPINQLALKLPSFGGLGQGKIWVWRRDQ